LTMNFELKQNALLIADEVTSALASGVPVVALESSIIAQGLPYPLNLRTALEVEATVREQGAMPATIGVIDGNIVVGMNRGQIETFAASTRMLKLSCADLPAAVACGHSGATTVATTLLCSRLARIDVIATGGMGGVHRRHFELLDISRDVVQLSQSSSIVVASGIKAILDIANSLEILETLGVSVVTYGSREFPAFWSTSSGIESPLFLDDTRQIAATLLARRQLGLDGGVLVANPIATTDEISRSEIEPWIESALAEARKEGVGGKQITPFLLARLYQLSEGRTVDANRKLVVANAALAARIANDLDDCRYKAAGR